SVLLTERPAAYRSGKGAAPKAAPARPTSEVQGRAQLVTWPQFQKGTMNNIVNDELDLIDVPAATVAPAATTTTATAPAAVPSNIESWDADDVSKGVLKGSGVPYVKVAENQPVRIALVPNSKIVGAAVHYSQASSKY